ncbi:MAG TPA: hypothetical protein VHB46_19235 [Burkholderiales bacterium]|nr:hypothetical protein [Burkholderiales bacterium]
MSKLFRILLSGTAVIVLSPAIPALSADTTPRPESDSSMRAAGTNNADAPAPDAGKKSSRKHKKHASKSSNATGGGLPGGGTAGDPGGKADK